MDQRFSQKFYYHCFFILLFLLAVRLFANYFVPLMDSTEARYGEIAREMLWLHNWVTLMHNYGQPFLAKPPLSTWLSACSMSLFGINEFAARLPSLLLSLATLGLIWGLAKKQSGSKAAIISFCILAGSMYFFLNAGAVMTDASLVFCLTLGFVAFWYTLKSQSTRWAYLFFSALGFGLLAKGPLSTVLIAMPILAFVALRNEWKNLWLQFPWGKGCLLTLAIALPWYLLAEIRTPGFLNYFIIGEHINRFLVPSWSGNKYGYSHAKPYGMIWVYFLAGLLPWSVVACYWLSQRGKKIAAFLYQQDEGWLLFLVLWAVVPLVFFSFSRNIIYPYVFPCLPPFALLFAELWHRQGINEKSATIIIYLMAVMGVGFLFLSVLYVLIPQKIAKTQKSIVHAWLAENPPPGSKLIYWHHLVDYSAQFYSQGRAISAWNEADLQYLLRANPQSYLVVEAKDHWPRPSTLSTQFTQIGSFQIASKQRYLFRAIAGTNGYS